MTDPSVHVEIRPGAYADSVALLQVSRQVQGVPGVAAAQVAMATPLNLDVLAGMGFDVPADTTVNDLVIAIRLAPSPDSGDALTAALAVADAALTHRAPASSVGSSEAVAAPRTTAAALRRTPHQTAALALVSVPGRHAFVEAMDALDAGCDVMIFSDNVPVEQEVTLKLTAADRGLLVMGPDCGTAVVDGLGLGFANAVSPGPVGIVAASGTGCQQLMTLLDAAGVGVSHALGLGGRDLSAEVGGLAAREALRRLDADDTVELIVLVSKPPAVQVAAELTAYAATLATPVELALLGEGQPDLTAATERLLRRLARPAPTWTHWLPTTPRRPHGALLRGLFVGGTLSAEAALIASARLGEVATTPDALARPAHAVVDFGVDELTVGRAHPMIDPTLRSAELARLADDPDTGVLLLDVVLGHGAEADPAAGLTPLIASAQVPVVVAIVGTELDPQVLSVQAERLAAAGAEVYLSNAEATRRALDLLEVS